MLEGGSRGLIYERQMEALINNAEAINNLSASVLLAVILILLGYFYRRDFIRQRKNNVEEKVTLIGIIEKDIESRDRNAAAMLKLATSIEGLDQYLRAKVG